MQGHAAALCQRLALQAAFAGCTHRLSDLSRAGGAAARGDVVHLLVQRRQTGKGARVDDLQKHGRPPAFGGSARPWPAKPPVKASTIRLRP